LRVFSSAKRLFAPRAATNKRLESAVLIIKPSAHSAAAVAKIIEILESHEVKVTSRGVLPSAEKERTKIVLAHLAPVQRWAEAASPSEIALPAVSASQFQKAFTTQWSEALEQGTIVTAAAALQALGLGTTDADAVALESMWNRSKRVRLADGIHCARLDATSTDTSALQDKLRAAPMFVINGFYFALRDRYLANTSLPMYLTIEWDGDVLSWADMATHLVGASDPARAEPSSVRGTLYASWTELGLPSQPSRETNCVHFSNSAFEAMVERLLFCKGAILFTDALGAQLLARGVSAMTIQHWLTNPQVGETTVFEHMKGKNAAECIAAAVPLQGKSTSPFSAAPNSRLISSFSIRFIYTDLSGTKRVQLQTLLKAKANIAGSKFHIILAPLAPLYLITNASLTCPADTHNRHSSIENCLVFCKPDTSSSPRAVELIKSQLELHGMKILQHARMSGTEARMRDIVVHQYPALHKFATAPATEVVLSSNETKQFHHTFAPQHWEDAQHNGSVLNSADACAALKIDPSALYELWERAEAVIRLRRGLYVARLDRNCAADATMRKKLNRPIWVVNGFYLAMTEAYYNPSASLDYFICEWDESHTTWSQVLSHVVGVADPANAIADSIRGVLVRQWEALGLEHPPSAKHNCLHISTSAFAGLADRLLWKKGSMLYTDLFGSRLLSARIKSAQITEWTKNPEVVGQRLFETLHGLNSADCIESLLKMTDSGARK
jgi:nucleoside diphosphate kinase